MQRFHSRLWVWAAVVVVVLTAAACRSPAPPDAPNAVDSRIVYVVRRTWHIDIGFTAGDLQSPLAGVRGAFPDAKYLEFGFGDRQYLASRHRGAGTLASALWPGPGLILMTALELSPQAAFGAEHVYELRVNVRQMSDIQQFIWRSLMHDQDSIQPLEPGPYEGSAFYAAVPKYSAVHTCNTWAAEALRAAQLPVRSTGVVFAGQLWSEVHPLAQPQAPSRGKAD
jgi:hypothetical protein